jgi:hypothetical protein
MQQPNRARATADLDAVGETFDEPATEAASPGVGEERRQKSEERDPEHERRYKRRIDCSSQSSEPSWSRGRYR